MVVPHPSIALREGEGYYTPEQRTILNDSLEAERVASLEQGLVLKVKINELNYCEIWREPIQEHVPTRVNFSLREKIKRKAGL